MTQLLFVYGAGSDLFSTITDFAHKILFPSTYSCKLCALTYGHFSMKKEWKRYVEGLPMKVQFVYRDAFTRQTNQGGELPAIFLQDDEGLKKLITKEEIEACRSLRELQNLITEKLQQHDQHNHSHLPRG